MNGKKIASKIIKMRNDLCNSVAVFQNLNTISIKKEFQPKPTGKCNKLSSAPIQSHAKANAMLLQFAFIFHPFQSHVKTGRKSYCVLYCT